MCVRETASVAWIRGEEVVEELFRECGGVVGGGVAGGDVVGGDVWDGVGGEDWSVLCGDGDGYVPLLPFWLQPAEDDNMKEK